MFSLFLALVALVPGIAAWWTGRRFARLLDDPALRELLVERRRRLTQLSGGAMAVMIAAVVLRDNDFLAIVWPIPLLFLARSVGDYELRRTLGIDVNNLPTQMRRAAKSFIGRAGYGVMLIVTPFVLAGLDVRRPSTAMLALSLGVVLLLWQHWFFRVWLWSSDAKPASDADLLARTNAVAARARIAPPPLYMIGGKGVRLATAFALPRGRRSAICLGNALVELLEPDEVAAIYAHELSHIEQYGPSRVRRIDLVSRTLIVLAVALPLLASWLHPSIALMVTLLAWPLVLVLALAALRRHRKADETTSDLRAAELCGDPEVVIRALVKVHTYNFIPRRWAVDAERKATHPSLTRRIQALRGEAAHTAPSAGAPTVLETAREGTYVVFDQTQAHWLDGVAGGTPAELDALRRAATSVRSVAWHELVELRIAIRGGERALQAVHRNRDKWSVPLQRAQVGPAQHALDQFDIRLHRDLGERPSDAAPRGASLLLVLAIMWSSPFSAALVPALLAAIRPSAASLAAAGAAAVAGGLFGFTHEWIVLGRPPIAFVASVAAGAVVLSLVWLRLRDQRKRDGVRLTAWVVGAAAALTLLVLAAQLSGEPLAAAVRGAAMPSFGVLLAGLAAAVALAPARAARVVAGAAAACALLAVVLPVLALGVFSRGRFARNTATATEIARVDVGSSASELSLSPSGKRFLVRQIPLARGDGSDAVLEPRFAVGDSSGIARSFAASRAAFLDDDHLLVLRDSAGRLSVRLENVREPAVVWTAFLPHVADAPFTIAAGDSAWTIFGANAAADSAAVVTGSRGGGDIDAKLVALRLDEPPAPDSHILEPIVAGPRVMIAKYQIDEEDSPALAIVSGTARADLWDVTPGRGAARKLATFSALPTCDARNAGPLICAVATGSDVTELWSIPDSGAAQLVGTVPMRARGRLQSSPLAHVTARLSGGDMLDIDAAARTTTRIRLPSHGFALDARTAPGRAAILTYERGRASVVLYRVSSR